ncbi:YbaK/EbsC family protein [Celeribacter indicus]|uniref:Cys-tRNA(Pro)/Cys-tRNA(Cys) deacylase n=1 Tax=Celeribacter indicus TaxID=1208324 RepID=A0A0B5E4V3_9RHOB|nr:YbaK/EbsC family protein [Celeribacter indicus]AJE48380.1 ybaK/ebsC protein [Celeribacter indicus]SDW74400.1 Cys-tRNA(Pro)/Cys-tRNA(Cys) deacylase [Celeribacter indicus]
MSTATPATRYLDKAGLAYARLEYEYVPGQDRIAEQAARAIGLPPGRVLKTLMVEVDGTPACAVIPADLSLSMKKVAKAFGGKSAQMMDPAKAERLTGFHTGGISPFGQKRPVPVAFEAAAVAAGEEVALNGGRRGLMLRLDPAGALATLGATAAALCAP